MKLTKTILKERFRIFNPYGIAEQQDGHKVYIDYSPQTSGLAGLNARWSVVAVTAKTDPHGHWRDDGTKVFPCWHPLEDKEEHRLEAIAWATERYGITEWERSPFGSYHPKGTLERLNAPADAG